MARVVHPIEKQSYEILRARVDTSGLPPRESPPARRYAGWRIRRPPR